MFRRNKENKKAKGASLEERMKPYLDGSKYGEFVSKNSIFLVFCCVLVLLYITNSYGNEDQLRRIYTNQEEITRLRYKSITVSAALMGISKPTQVAERVAERNMGLEFSTEPPYIIEK